MLKENPPCERVFFGVTSVSFPMGLVQQVLYRHLVIREFQDLHVPLRLEHIRLRWCNLLGLIELGRSTPLNI